VRFGAVASNNQSSEIPKTDDDGRSRSARLAKPERERDSRRHEVHSRSRIRHQERAMRRYPPPAVRRPRPMRRYDPTTDGPTRRDDDAADSSDATRCLRDARRTTPDPDSARPRPTPARPGPSCTTFPRGRAARLRGRSPRGRTSTCCLGSNTDRNTRGFSVRFRISNSTVLLWFVLFDKRAVYTTYIKSFWWW